MAHYFRYVPNFAYVNRDTDSQGISDYKAVKNIFKRGKIREDIFGDLQFFEKYQIIGDERPDNVAFKLYDDETLDWVVLLSNNIVNIQSEWPLPQSTFDEIMLEKYGFYENLYSGIHHYETEAIVNSQGVTLLAAGIQMNPTWKTNGNFLEVISNRITTIVADTETNEVTVILQDGIFGLVEGSQVYISNVTPTTFNGSFVVTSTAPTGAVSPTSFTFNLGSTPPVALPTMGGSERANFTINNSTNVGNAHYYEYYDSGLGYSIQVPSTSFIRAVTNYEYENSIEEAKRNVYVLKPRYLSVLFDDLESIMPYKKGGSQYVNATLKKGDNIRLYD